MFIEMDESSPTATATRLWVEKTMNMPQLLVRESSETTGDFDTGFLVQRWVSESNLMSIDSSPTPPRMSSTTIRLQVLWGSGEGRWNNNNDHIDKQQHTLSRPPVRCSDDDEDDYSCCMMPLFRQRWESESERSRDECCPPAPPSCGLRRWDSESESSFGGAAYNNKSAPLLPKQVVESSGEPDEEAYIAMVA